MTGPKQRLCACLSAAGILLAGCGGGSSPAGGASPVGSPTATSSPPKLAHADPVTLLPTGTQVSSLIRPTSAPSRYDQTLNFSTLSSAFASKVPAAMSLASGTAELDLAGARGSFLYVHVFVFRTLAGAQSLTGRFLSSTRLRTVLGRPSGAPGQQGQGSSQAYGSRQRSYRFAFRESNVLAYVELDGPQAKYSLSRAVQVAALTDARIRAALRS
jgi:hypothetical protein